MCPSIETHRNAGQNKGTAGLGRNRSASRLAARLCALSLFGITAAWIGMPMPLAAAPQSADTEAKQEAKSKAEQGAGKKTGAQSGKPTRLDMAIRDDFFVGYGGDTARLARGMKTCEQMMAKYPKFAEAMVWHGGGLVYQSGQLFQKGDTQKGMAMWQKGLDEMDAAVKLEPNNLAVLIPRAATLIPTARYITYKTLADSLWRRALSDYEKTYAFQKAGFETQPAHNKGELLFGLAEANARLGKEENARAYLKQIQQVCKDTPYMSEAQTWLDKKTLTSGLPARQCIGCHSK